MAITIRPGEKPLLVMDGTGDNTKLWLFDPKQETFFSYEREGKFVPVRLFKRNGNSWFTLLSAENEKWNPVIESETIKLLEDMNEVLIHSAERSLDRGARSSKQS